jgi:HAD superfamily hydrolase (TIGR01490 family)
MTQEAAIFDVDGTLGATRSTTSLIWHRSRQHSALRHGFWLASLAWRAPLAFATDCISRGAADAMVYAQFKALSESELLADAELCCETLLVPSLFPDALAEIDLHRKAGRRIVLLSGGIDVVLAPLARRLNADLIAQRLEVRDGRFTGTYRSYSGIEGSGDALSQSERKSAALCDHAKRTGIDLPGSFAYGDSVNDIGMLSRVGTAVAINPDRRLRKMAGEKNWAIKEWRSA